MKLMETKEVSTLNFQPFIVAILIGSIVVWSGAMIGSILAMLIGRYLLREWVGKKARKYKVFGAIDTAIEKEVRLILK